MSKSCFILRINSAYWCWWSMIADSTYRLALGTKKVGDRWLKVFSVHCYVSVCICVCVCRGWADGWLYVCVELSNHRPMLTATVGSLPISHSLPFMATGSKRLKWNSRFTFLHHLRVKGHWLLVTANWWTLSATGLHTGTDKRLLGSICMQKRLKVTDVE